MKSALANVKSAPPRWRTRISRWKQLKMNKISKRISKDFRWIKSCDYRWSMRTTTGNLFARKSNSRSFFEHPTWVLIKLLCIPSKRWDLAFFLVLYKSYNKNITEHRNEYLLYFENQLKIIHAESFSWLNRVQPFEGKCKLGKFQPWNLMSSNVIVLFDAAENIKTWPENWNPESRLKCKNYLLYWI